MKKPVIAIVDDDESMRESVGRLLRSLGFDAVCFASGDDFLAFPRPQSIRCLITDVHMPGMSGLDLYRRLEATNTNIPTILMTAYPDNRVRARALSAGVTGYLIKPFEEKELLASVHSALDHRHS